MYIIPKTKDPARGSVPNAKQIADDWVGFPHLRKDIKSAIQNSTSFDSEKFVINLEIAKRLGREKAVNAVQKRIIFYKEFERNMGFWAPELSLVEISKDRAEPTAYVLVDSNILGVWKNSMLSAQQSGLNHIAKEHKRVAESMEHVIKFYMAKDPSAKVKEISWFLHNLSTFSLFISLGERNLFNKQEILGCLKVGKFTAQEIGQITNDISVWEQISANTQ